MPPTSTRIVLRQKLLRRIDWPAHPINSTTTSSGSSTALNDTILAPASQREDFEGAWILITELVGAGPAIGEIARVTNVDFTGSTSQLILAPALTATTQNGTDYEIHRQFHPDILHQVIDDVLDELEHPVILPLSLVSDGDMETSGVGQWTASNSTLSKDTSTVLHGRQSLSVTATAANGQARSATVDLPPNTEVLCAADVFITGGDSAKLILRRITATAADLETAESAATGWVHLEFKFTTGTDVEQVALYLESQANNDVTLWDNAILLPTKQAQFDYPGSLEFSDELIKIFFFERGTGLSATTDDFAFKLFEKKTSFWGHAQVERDETGVIPYRVELLNTPITHPLWVDGRIDYGALTSDTTTTLAPKELVTELSYAKILDMKAETAWDEGDNDRATSLLAKAADVRIKIANEYRGFQTNRAVVFGTLGSRSII